MDDINIKFENPKIQAVWNDLLKIKISDDEDKELIELQRSIDLKESETEFKKAYDEVLNCLKVKKNRSFERPLEFYQYYKNYVL